MWREDYEVNQMRDKGFAIGSCLEEGVLVGIHLGKEYACISYFGGGIRDKFGGGIRRG